MFTAIGSVALLCSLLSLGAVDADRVFDMPETSEAFFNQWRPYPSGIQGDFTTRRSEPTLSLAIEKEGDAEAVWNHIYRTAPTYPGRRYCASVTAEAVGVEGGNGVVVSLGFYDADDKRVAQVENYVGPGNTGPREVKLWAEAPESAVSVRLLLLLHGFGEAYFSGVQLVELPAAAQAPDGDDVVITISEEEVAELVGFGFEDDGWFYNAHNAEKGVDEAAIALREARIEWMQADYVRMFFWYNDWNPAMDAETFTWDSDNMVSHYRTLDLYQRLGARVKVCGVEWAVKDPWGDHETLARAIGALMEHLIVEKGYTCIQDYTLTNEPDIFFARAVERPAESFETFVQIHVAVAQEFKRRGLDLNIVGSDDGNNRAWFARSVEDDVLFELSSLYASHFYFDETLVPMAGHILGDRVDVLHQRSPRKPFVVAELGFSDERTKPPDTNPLMGEYAYAMHAMSTFLDGLNVGTVGWSIWCVHEMYYPGGATPMRFGLWDFDPPEWPVRPIYHALALMTRHTSAGDVIYRTASSHPDWVKAARVGGNLFWVNLAENPMPVSVSGASLHEVRAYTEDALTDDRDCSLELILENDGVFFAPPRSFGMAVVGVHADRDRSHRAP